MEFHRNLVANSAQSLHNKMSNNNSPTSSDTSRSHSPVPSATSVSTVPSVGNIKPPEEITDADRSTAASIKAEANKAFQGAFQFHSSASTEFSNFS
jgi:hypothetical protein